MAAPFTRASLGRGPGIITINGATLYTRSDFVAKHAPVWNPEKCSMYGQIDKTKHDLVIKLPITVFGLWTSLSALFPSYALNPTIGASIFGVSDNAFVVLARNGDQITYPNAQITKLLDLHLGVDSELFAAALEVTAIIKNGANPEDSGAYFVRASSQTYAEPGFALTNFVKTRWTAAWGSKTGFTTIVGQKGFDVAWTFDAKPVYVEGWGTVDFTVGDGGLVGACKAIPIGPTGAQVDTQQATAAAHGALLSAGGADLTLAGGSSSVVLKTAGMTESSTAFGAEPLRIGEMAWETTRGFSSGTPAAIATVS